MGIFTMIEDECKMAKPNTEHFIAQFRTEYGKKPNPKLSFPAGKDNEFVVRHFSEDVQYNTV